MSSKTSLLWKLSLPGSGYCSYLFGTMHIRDQRAFNGLDKVFACIDACQSFALEIDLNEEEGPAGAMAFRFPGHSSLFDHLSARAYCRLRRIILKAFEVDIHHFGHFTPIALTEIITGKVLAEDHPLFLDAFLWEYASEKGKDTSGIETREEQFALLKRIPLEDQIKTLRDIGRNTARFRAMLHKMAEVYQKGDLINLYHLSRKSAGSLRKWMLFDRNRIMAERIAQKIRGQSVFCGVGAAHLWGGKGVLRLLKQRGILVEPVHLV